MSISDRTTWPWGLIINICAYGNFALAYIATRSLTWTVAIGVLGLVLLTLGRVGERLDRVKGGRHVDQ